MREIKFRFWSKILKKFVVPDGSILQGALKDPEMIVQLCTNLTDIKGREIFEGDIIVNLVTHSNGKEYRHNKDFKVVQYSLDGKNVGFNIGKGRHEVIGNVCENTSRIKPVDQSEEVA